ncbi:MAG TPA: zinc-dependent alcohol dehydrogenase family protein [Anaerolineae bacterium]|nr:zinc-dependent alcohol dehydrogenase family protein [Anaerolineae bacterium]
MRPQPLDRQPLMPVERAVPDPGAGEIRIRVHACGVCHTDLHIVEGDIPLPKLPIVPGHQIVGVVDTCGPDAERFRAGERVGVPWLYSTDGTCEYCRTGRENLCETARFTGYHVDGGFAEYVVAPEAFAYPLPEGFDELQAAPLLCAGVIGYRALRLSEIEPGQRLGLYGFGASAHIAIQVARYWGCEVYVFTRSEAHRRHATALGAAWTGRAEDTPPARLHSSIIFAPAGSLIPAALRVLRSGGTLALAGITMSPIPPLPYELIYHERTLRSVANATRRDAEELLSLAAKIPIHTDVEALPLAQVNEALRRVKHSETQGAVVVQVR